MPDLRFFQAAPAISLGRLAELTGAELVRGEASGLIGGAAPLSHAGALDVTYLSDPKRSGDLATSRAGAVFIDPRNVAHAPAATAVLATRFPQAAWAKTAGLLHPLRSAEASAAIDPSAAIGDGVVLGVGVVVGPQAQIGAGTVLHPGAVIGPGVTIGRSCHIGANVSIQCALVGDNVTMLAGARIGEAGFAVADGPNGPVDVPQLGRAVLQDNVTVGANSCIDRGGYDDTVIGENTRIDNLVHVGHNVRIGRGCRLAAFTGISGSVMIGDGVLFGGKAGVADWVTIGDKAAVGASASVFKDIPSGEVWTGFPARPMRRWLREQATLARLAKPARGERDE